MNKNRRIKMCEEGGRRCEPSAGLGSGSERPSPALANRGHRGEGGRKATGRGVGTPGGLRAGLQLSLPPVHSSSAAPPGIQSSAAKRLGPATTARLRACPEARAPRGRGLEALPGAGGAGRGGSGSGGEGPGAGGGGGGGGAAGGRCERGARPR